MGLGPPFFLHRGKDMAGINPEQFQQLLGQLFAAITNHEPTVLAKINALLEKIPEAVSYTHLTLPTICSV